MESVEFPDPCCHSYRLLSSRERRRKLRRKYVAVHLLLLLAPHLEQLERCTALVELVLQILLSLSVVFVSTKISTYRLGLNVIPARIKKAGATSNVQALAQKEKLKPPLGLAPLVPPILLRH